MSIILLNTTLFYLWFNERYVYSTSPLSKQHFSVVLSILGYMQNCNYFLFTAQRESYDILKLDGFNSFGVI